MISRKVFTMLVESETFLHDSSNFVCCVFLGYKSVSCPEHHFLHLTINVRTGINSSNIKWLNTKLQCIKDGNKILILKPTCTFLTLISKFISNRKYLVVLLKAGNLFCVFTPQYTFPYIKYVVIPFKLIPCCLFILN